MRGRSNALLPRGALAPALARMPLGQPVVYFPVRAARSYYDRSTDAVACFFALEAGSTTPAVVVLEIDIFTHTNELSRGLAAPLGLEIVIIKFSRFGLH